MSMFWCADCGNLSDADDGCEEVPGDQLICAECMAERELEANDIAEREEEEKA